MLQRSCELRTEILGRECLGDRRGLWLSDERVGYYESERIVTRLGSLQTYTSHNSASLTITLSLSAILKQIPTGSPNTVYWQGRDRTEWSGFVGGGVNSVVLYEEALENGVYYINLAMGGHYH